MSLSFKQLARVAMAAFATALIAACGGGGVSGTPAPGEAVFTTNPRALPAEYTSRQAVNYGPYRSDNRVTELEKISIDQFVKNIEEDLKLLADGKINLIRLFNTSDTDGKIILDVIAANKDLDIKVQLGAYVNTFKYVGNPSVKAQIQADNIKELDRAVALATDAKYKDIILAVSVGNETMVNWSGVPIDPTDMAVYIKYVRDKVTQPVTTDDNFLFYSNPIPKIITDQIDFAAIHAYPNIDTEYPDGKFYWDWKQLSVPAGPARAQAMMDASIVELKRQYQMSRDALDSMGLRAMPIVIGETGWKARITGDQTFRAHPVNQKMYFQRLEKWRQESRLSGAGPANIFYFEAFDEPWKQSDDGWGLFNVDRKARYVVQNLYPQTKWESTTLTDADAVYFVPPVIAPAFAGNEFALYSDTLSTVTGYNLDAFDGSTAPRNLSDASTSAPSDAGVSMAVTPAPANYGWGLLYSPQVARTTQNLEAFKSVNAWIKTTYVGKIEFGLSTLDTDGNSHEAFVQIGNGEYGYCNTGNWCRVSVPLSAFKAKNAKLDFRLVLNPFYVSDRYEYTGKTLNSNIKTPLNIDGIHWAR
ncbi:MAG: glycosyl hydrolase family 17 protein [Hydrogenophaga sp.]|uniref:glycosyl hydrolase family 17 protein n=1 Tax=Hydrogenophaga sp. TaxID=1904254 RepID=UPI002ABB5CE4|nr:glycosyl hydrolase family 17 protein [Hydrogenophaga sp.]MDZ4187033.1 glycosyl hydrolase family 17 protein [Hydrogenophaga sp.]